MDALDAQSLSAHFQPIISVKKKRSVGAEGLARGRDPLSGRPISPLDLFRAAKKQGRLLELDRLCRRRALEGFVPLHGKDPELLLFINFESSVLDGGVLGSGAFSAQVRELGLTPENVVIEINESQVRSMELLRAFVDRHRAQGYLIALDDLGAGHSNLQRLALLKPDILKLDRSLIQNLGSDFFKQEIFKSLVGLGRNLGALVLAEGVETEDEVAACLNFGADLFQGYYFARPCAPEAWDLRGAMDGVAHMALRHKDAIVRQMLRRRDEADKRRGLLTEIAQKLSQGGAGDFDRLLGGAALDVPDLECLYVLDRQGLQLSQTSTFHFPRGRGHLFQPALPGTDHSMKDYYYGLTDAGLSRFITDPYVSLASGNLCRTLSCFFKDSGGKEHILCMDVLAGEA
jgi:EAL domain-containing protein (putative c-di-GMP-specific phosphodiesterase class I)